MNILKKRYGQVLVEFAIVIVLFFVFIFGLMGVSLWGTAGFLAQEIAHESAREYAVTLDKNRAEKLGKNYLGRWGYIFIEPGSTQISLEVDDNIGKTQATVTITPRIQKLFIFSMPNINRTSQATLEHFYRASGKDEYLW